MSSKINLQTCEYACKSSIFQDNQLIFITSVKEIMEEFDYPGIRMMIEANLERMRQPFKIDISTDDAITPGAVEYKYKLMFEDISISVLSYNFETLLSEKMQTILARMQVLKHGRNFIPLLKICKIQKCKYI